MSESSDDELLLNSPELVQTVQDIELSFLPERSRERYMKAYDSFNAWKQSKGVKTFSETTMLSYFIELSKTKKPSTLWSAYFMLKATINVKKDINIGNYPKVLDFLKKTSTGHKPKRSKMLSASNIEQFLHEAPDREYLPTKVALIIGVSGACRTSELTYLSTKNIEKHSDNLLLVSLPNPKTNGHRTFMIRDEYAKIVEKYMSFRPADTPIDRLFLQFRKGKCVKQPMGCTSMGGLPRDIATFLGLKDPELYTGHCFRSTSAVLLSDSGADLTTLRRQGGCWRPNAAKGCAEDSGQDRDVKKKKKEPQRKEEGSTMEFENITLPQSSVVTETDTESLIKVEIMADDDNSDSAVQEDSFVDDSVINDTLNANFEEKYEADDNEQAHDSTKPMFQQDVTEMNDPIMTSPSTTSSTNHTATARKQTSKMTEEYLEIAKQKLRIKELELQSSSNLREPKSEDYHFLMSILSTMEQLPPIQKMRLRNKINQALLEEMELSSYGNERQQNSNASRASCND